MEICVRVVSGSLQDGLTVDVLVTVDDNTATSGPESKRNVGQGMPFWYFSTPN